MSTNADVSSSGNRRYGQRNKLTFVSTMRNTGRSDFSTTVCPNSSVASYAVPPLMPPQAIHDNNAACCDRDRRSRSPTSESWECGQTHRPQSRALNRVVLSPVNLAVNLRPGDLSIGTPRDDSSRGPHHCPKDVAQGRSTQSEHPHSTKRLASKHHLAEESVHFSPTPYMACVYRFSRDTSSASPASTASEQQGYSIRYGCLVPGSLVEPCGEYRRVD